MIFVTVGTHEQPFNRLIQEIDRLKSDGSLKEEVIIQSGYSTYQPKHCEYKKLFTYDEIQNYIRKSRIIITHGGPASFMMPLQIGKVPVVVPRKCDFGEHVNNHQVEFTKAVEHRYKSIICVSEISDLKSIVLNYNEIISKISKGMDSNNIKFNKILSEIINDLLQ